MTPLLFYNVASCLPDRRLSRRALASSTAGAASPAAGDGVVAAEWPAYFSVRA